MLQRFAVPVCTFTALLAAPAAAQGADVIEPSSRSVSTLVAAGGTATVTLTCRAGALAMNAAVTRQGSGVRLLRSVPGREADDWRMTFAARQGAGGRRVTAAIRCVQLDLPRGVSTAQLGERTRRQSRIELTPGESQSVQLRCGRAWVATGHGLDRGRRGDVQLASAVPTAHGWDFVLENTGSATARAGVSVRCIRRVVSTRQSGEPVSLAFEISRREYSDEVSSGDATFSHSCPARRFAVATGSSVDQLDTIALIRSNPDGTRDAHWVFGEAGEGDAVTNHLVCLDKRTRFR